MKYLLNLLVLPLLFSCAVVEPERELVLLAPDSFDHLNGPPASYKIVRVDMSSGGEDSWEVTSGERISVLAPKGRLSCFLLYPQGWDFPFAPKPAALYVDPAVSGSVSFQWSGGPAGELIRQWAGEEVLKGFNFPRLFLLSEERLGNQAWKREADLWVEKIEEGKFSSIYIRLPEASSYTMEFPPGEWICEDPAYPGFTTQEISQQQIPMVPDQGLRFLDCETGTVAEVVCDASGRLLYLFRYP